MKIKKEKTEYKTKITRYWKDGTKESVWIDGIVKEENYMENIKNADWINEMKKVTFLVKKYKKVWYEETAPCGQGYDGMYA
jgi:hypothetical protein